MYPLLLVLYQYQNNMTEHPYYTSERSILRKNLLKWRLLALVLFIAIIWVSMKEKVVPTIMPYQDGVIAKIKIEGFIEYDEDRLEKIKGLLKNNNIKAVILYISSPGGSSSGSISLYEELSKVAHKMPLVTVINGIAASGGYMAALPAVRIFASSGSIVGSVGVISESFDVTELAQMLGVKPIIMKSSPLKAVPNPFEKMNEEMANSVRDVINDLYDTFVEMVSKERFASLDKSDIMKICDGRVYTSNQAVKIGLIDEIGDEDMAVEWLKKHKGINANAEVVDFELDNTKTDRYGWFSENNSASIGKFLGEILINVQNTLHNSLTSISLR